MIVGTGIDIIEISRIRRMHHKYGDSFLKRVFSKNELSYCLDKKDPAPHLAGRFAAKEAFIKAVPLIRSRRFSLNEIEIISDDVLKKPRIKLLGKTKIAYLETDEGTILVSISHGKDYAVAQVIIALDSSLRSE